MFSEIRTHCPSREGIGLSWRSIASAGLLLASLLPAWARAALPIVNSEVVVPAPAAMRSVECGRFPTQAEVAALITKLVAEGYGPVWQRTREDGSIQVLVGKCEYLADAIWLRNSLRKNGYPDAAERTFRDLEGLGNFVETQFPDEGLVYSKKPIVPTSQVHTMVESIEGPSLLPRPVAPTSQDAATSSTLFNAAVAHGQLGTAAALGFAILETMPDNDINKGPLMITSARQFVRSEGKALPVIEKFLKVARGEVSAPPSAQLEARWLVADSWHYYFSKPLKAREAYQEILTLHGNEPKVRARAMAEIVASMLELARSQQATFEEVRRACQQLHATVPRPFERAHAVADLIDAETYFYDGQYKDAITRFDSLIAAYPDRPRETAMAHLYLAETAYKAGDWTLSKTHYEAVLGYDFSDPKESFYWQGERWNLKKRAADNLLFKAKEQGDIETAATYEAYIQNESYLAGIPAEDPAFDKAYPHSFYELTSSQ
jgi:tetratricopeptide (TPR) repeat protein